MKSNFKQLTLVITMTLALTPLTSRATKLNATPLPHGHSSKDFSSPDSETIIEQASLFQRRPDYRQLEKAQESEKAALAKQRDLAQDQAAKKEKELHDNQIADVRKRHELALAANNKAVTLGKQGHWLEAIQSHEEAVCLSPDNKQFRINLSSARVKFGQIKLAQGDIDSAASLFRKAVIAMPDNGLAGNLLTQALAKQGHDPMSGDERLALGDQLLAVGDIDGSSVEYGAALALDPSAHTYTKMGDLAQRYSQIAGANSWYRQAINKEPNYSPAHRQLGLLCLAQKDLPGAAASLRKAVILNPHDTLAGQALVEIWRRQVAANPLLAENHLGLAGALQLTGDLAGADGEYRRLEALDPKNPGLEPGRSSLSHAIQHEQAGKHKLAAETLFNQGLRREALAEISQAVMLEPRNAQHQFLLAECLEALGDCQGAHQAYLTCVLIDPANNQEAAKRMKAMQFGGTANFSAQSNLPTAPAQTVAQTNLPGKDLFEDGPHGEDVDLNLPRCGFRTHEETDSGLAESSDKEHISVAAGTTNQAVETSNNQNDALANIDAAEKKHDYTQAVNLLREVLANNLQDALIHHRLAINLLAQGDVTEAVAELRIASALKPQEKSYANDLAQALAIHKRSDDSQQFVQADSTRGAKQ